MNEVLNSLSCSEIPAISIISTDITFFIFWGRQRWFFMIGLLYSLITVPVLDGLLLVRFQGIGFWGGESIYLTSHLFVFPNKKRVFIDYTPSIS